MGKNDEHIVVVGELNVDFIVSGEDVKPEWNREKIISEFDMVLGSSSAITACGLAGLGENVCFVGVVGDDMFGEFCIEKLSSSGVDTSFIRQVPYLKTGVTFSLSDAKDRSLLTFMGSIPHLNSKDVPYNLLRKAKHIHFGSYYLQEGMQDHWNQLFSFAKKNNISTSFDTGWDPNEEWRKESISQLLRYTDLFIPSEEEFKNIFDVVDESNVFGKLPDDRIGQIVIKCGAEGSCLLSEKKVEKAVGYPVDVIDTTGAGDSFNAGLIHAFLEGRQGLELLAFANACGALATLRIGGAEEVPDKEKIRTFLNSFD